MSVKTLPEFCGPINFDMNRDWPCKRLSFAYSLHTFAADIAQTEKRLARARNAYVIRNLTNWVADAHERYERLAVHANERPCTCPAPYATRRNTPELSACTC